MCIGRGVPAGRRHPNLGGDWERIQVYATPLVREDRSEPRIRLAYLWEGDRFRPFHMPPAIGLAHPHRWVAYTSPFTGLHPLVMWNRIVQFAYLADRTDWGYDLELEAALVAQDASEADVNEGEG